MRILQITRSMSPTGGISHVAYSLAREFRKAGTEVENYCWYPPEEAEGPDLGGFHGSSLGGFCRALPGKHLRLLIEVPLFTLWATFRAKSRSGDVAIVHGDSLKGDLFVAHSCHRAAIDVKRRSGNRSWMLYPLHWFLMLRERTVFRRRPAPRLAAISSSVGGEFTKHYGLPEERIVPIPNGVDLERFRPVKSKRALRAELGLPVSSFLVLLVANEFDRKGLSIAIEALGLIGDAPSIHLAVIGRDNPDRYREEARILDIEDRVLFLGEKQNVEIYDAAADALLLLSDYEPFGLVGLEALASGTPVVATRCGGIEEYLEEGRNGIFVERNPASAAKALGRLAANPDELAGLTAAARSSAEPFGWDRIAARYLDLCERIHREGGS